MRRRTLRGTFWIVTGRSIRIPVNIIVTAILARLLLPADFGVVVFVATLTGLATVVFDGSIGINIVRSPKLQTGEIGTSLLVNLVLGVILTVAAVAVAGPMERWMQMPLLAATLSTIALTIPVTAGASVFNALLQRHNDFKALAFASLAGQLSYAAVAVSLALNGNGVWALAFGLIASVLVETALNAVSARRWMEWRINGQALRTVISNGSAFTLARVLSWAAASFDKLATAQLGAAPLGYYSRASAFFTIANQSLGAGLMRALLSSFAHISGEKQRLARGYVRVLEVMVLMSTVVAANVVLFAPEVVGIVLGPGWGEVVSPLRILFVGLIARTLNSASEALTATIASNRQNVVRQGAQLLLVVVFVSAGLRFGIDGVAAGYAVALWTFHAGNLIAIRKWVGLSFSMLAEAHMRPIAIASPAIIVGASFVSWADAIDSPFIRLLVGGCLTVGAFVLTVQLSPRPWLGHDLGDVRRTAQSKLHRLIAGREAA